MMDNGTLYRELKYRIWISDQLWRYIPPVILLLGTVANILTVLLMSRKKLRILNLAPSLIVLAISDILFLYSSLFRRWLKYGLNTDIRRNDIICKLFIWFTYTSSHISSWILVFITIERCVFIYFPIVARSQSKRSSTLIKLAGLVIFFMALNSHVLYGFGMKVKYPNSNRTYCTRLDVNYGKFFDIYWSWFDVSVRLFIPFTTLGTCNVAIIRKLRSGMKDLTEGQNKENKSRNVNLKLIVMLNVAFIVTLLPSGIELLIQPYLRHVSELAEVNFEVSKVVTRAFAYVGNCVNFFLYLMSGRLIRDEFIVMICGNRKPKDRDKPTVITDVSK